VCAALAGVGFGPEADIHEGRVLGLSGTSA